MSQKYKRDILCQSATYITFGFKMDKPTVFKSSDFIAQLSVDTVIVGYENGQLKCLLLRLGEKWMLPGGYIGQQEDVVEATHRILESRTGLKDQHIKFLQIFGAPDRNFEHEWENFVDNIEDSKVEIDDLSWFTKRFITLAYYALVDIAKTQPRISTLDDEWQWFDLAELPEMWMDHKKIARAAHERLKSDIKHEVVSYKLLPSRFTMPELHQLHQVILGENIDRSRFQKKMLSSGFFKRLPKLQKEAPGRKPYQYKVVD